MSGEYRRWLISSQLSYNSFWLVIICSLVFSWWKIRNFLLTLLPKCQCTCQMHSKGKQYPTVRIWNRESFIEGNARGWISHALKKTQTPQKPSAKTFYRKDEGGVWIMIANFLVSNPLLLRSGYGQVMTVLKISTKQLLFCSDEKRQGLKVWLLLSEIQVLAKGDIYQLEASSRPGPHTLPNCHSWGSQVPRTQLPSVKGCCWTMKRCLGS